MHQARAPTIPDVRKKRRSKRYLDPYTVWRLALSISKRLGVTILKPRRLLAQIRSGETTIYRGEDYTLWVDLTYIAVSPFGSDEVVYLYLTRLYIIEELSADECCARRLRPSMLDDSIRDQIQNALRVMGRESKDCAWRSSLMTDPAACRELDLKALWV